MEFRCCFCSAIEEEVPLIELSSNLLVIENTHYEFSRVFAELFGLTPSDLRTDFVCDSCKDQTTQFFVFKSTVENQVNRHRKMILTQVQDFLSQLQNLEDVQVVRKLCSITLQIDESERLTKAESFEAEPETTEVEHDLDDCHFHDVISESDGEVVRDDFVDEVEVDSIREGELERQCPKCGSSAGSNDLLDVHEFWKHSLLGEYIEGDFQKENLVKAIDDVGNVIKFCAICTKEVEESTFSVHLLTMHALEVVPVINEQFDIDDTLLNNDLIQNYIKRIQNTVTGSSSTTAVDVVDEEASKYFYSVYSIEATDFQVHAVVVSSDGDSTEEIDSPMTASMKTTKSTKNQVNLDSEHRTWLRKEANLRKKVITNDAGLSRPVYKCGYCRSHVSNSPAGFRYHLINIHLKDNRIDELREVTSDQTFELRVEKTGRNTCDECNLKFKDHKQFKSHVNCHRLFNIIAQTYLFPSCHTCNKIFIDEKTLDLHLANHHSNNGIAQSISVPCGAAALAGKLVAMGLETRNEAIENFSWSCGHCMKKFSKEVSCRYHLMMLHVTNFKCPIDKREFSGVKAASLFCHHLQNKHPDHFPELTFPCTFCKTEFSSIYEKLAHMKSCDSKKFFCDHCAKKFFKKSELLAHMKFVTGEVSHLCRICNKKCETMSDLKIHLRSHTKEKPFECPLCTKKFRTLAARSAHCESHNQPAVHNCFCGKSFKQRQLYRRHVKAFHEKDGKFSRQWMQQVDENSQ